MSESTIKEYSKKLKVVENRVRKYRAAEEQSDSESGSDNEEPAFRIEDINDEEFIMFFEREAKHSDGQWKAASTIEGYRNALVYYFGSKRLAVPTILQGDIHQFVKGMQRVIAEARRNGTYKENEGMDCLEF